MVIKLVKFLPVFIMLLIFPANECATTQELEVKVGAARTEVYIPKLVGKNVGLVANQTSLINTLM